VVLLVVVWHPRQGGLPVLRVLLVLLLELRKLLHHNLIG
jgi:hypothetical protein